MSHQQPSSSLPYSDRAGFLMGNPDREESRGLTVLCIGRPEEDSIASLRAVAGNVSIIEVPLPAEARLEASPEEVNRAIDASRTHWILIVRSGEWISPALSEEIASSAVEPPLSWGFRIRTELAYRERPMPSLQRERGEIRLFHRRHARFDLRNRGAELKVQGTVLRMKHTLRRTLFGSTAEHIEFLQRTAVPQSLLRRMLLFARRAVGTGALWRSRNALCYLWIECAFDRQADTLRGDSRRS